MQQKAAEAIRLFHLSLAGDEDKSIADVMGTVEVAHLLLIAATQMNGDASAAHSMYIDYCRHWSNRTVWRYTAYYSRLESHLSGFTSIITALKDSGMPTYADEHYVTPTHTESCEGDDFAFTPEKLPGADTWNTVYLASQMRSVTPPLILDVGHGAAVPPGAYFSNWSDVAETSADFAKRTISQFHGSSNDRTIVIMGDGPFGCDSYNVASDLMKSNTKQKFAWYRGGEEAWASAKLPFNDARP